ncbi:Pam3-gp28 family putative phage holin [Paracoccus aminophilus]|uniref:Uncharacterized protein n=1 Tax=Paracoccus aminophilus JCM 7686 TaxID=1367847 RepID=S5XT01_PARAH|nr:hypothetical protein [Paracoccus aminophilus]AGT07916.1 hypothetical protein JCM7686_0807 [Paracoccus aminophilus JCM 7686]AGT10533.1 hypothetical protein JCM7686_1258 [Paracoccus aminophilus JCM 7686]AGT10536.1 hypothetical protein JCM7686_1993 [Paracoccus aminophilus JCM 7686]AGT10574.1 hypothetical protein JCM7686_2616 [Paracoccus aminophilus JCM 7686]
MLGQIALIIRYILYPLAGALTALGFVSFDEATGTLTVYLNDLAVVLAGLVIYAATVIWSRVAKKKGGAT